MPRLYRTLRFVLRSALDVYFFDIRASGQEKIPPEGPLIFAANHPNSIMDTVLLGTQTDRQIRYMARSGLFKNPVVRAIFNHFGVIPIYRAQDSGEAGDTAQNESSFEKAFEALEEGSCIGIFPEGTNSLERRVRKLKTGTARIALSAEERNAFSLGVRIQPVGLNFEDRDRFLSSVLIRFGEPIDVSEYADRYEHDPRGTVRDLTDRLEKNLHKLATHIEDERHHELVRAIYDIYGARLKENVLEAHDLELDLYQRSGRQERLEKERTVEKRPYLEDRFKSEQRIGDAVAYFQRTDPVQVARIRMDIRRYYDHLNQLRVRHKLVEKGIGASGRRRDAVKMTAWAVLLGPLAIFGFINNFLPAAIVAQITRRQPDEAMVAFAGFLSGLLAFPLFYSIQAWMLFTSTEASPFLVALYVLVLPAAGLFFLRWWRQILAYRERILFRTFFRTEKNLLDDLERERLALIDSLEELKKKYLQAQRSETEHVVAESV